MMITEEMLPDLIAWRDEGYSSSQIAYRLAVKYGHSVTRNAVIGKLHRLRLAGTIKAKAPDEAAPKPPKPPKPKQAKPSLPAIVQKQEPKPKAGTPVEHLFVKAIGPVSVRKGGAAQAILDLVGCKWPIGDTASPDFHFCNAEPRHGAVYCEAHCRVAYTGIPAMKPKVEFRLRLVS